ncbi:PLP-dependent transferase [Gigaspora margarita]|uniref:alanine--glyoxylate transaminase n=1 Tax=Gigaspora margarita TaxID=4874 RepID=A0A8H3X3K1_GIGMA|nr:PLP-dependent transferase [Gigaspora margarita]
MSTLATSHVSPTFIPIFGEVIELLRKIFCTEKSQPFVVSGSGTLGWDMVASNLIESDEDVLVLNTGYFGDSFADCLQTYGVKVTQVKADIGDRPSLEEIRQALTTKKFKAITITHVDTSTGVLSDIKAISNLVQQISPETLVIVDGVCSVGSEEIRMDEWNIDIVLTASQKALGVPPGLCILIASERAMINSRPLELRFQQHKEVSNRIKNSLEELGLKFVPKHREIAANGMTAVYYPEGVKATDLIPKVAEQGVVIAGGLHKVIGPKYFRVGHMGISVTEPERKHVEKTIEALRGNLKDLGCKGDN